MDTDQMTVSYPQEGQPGPLGDDASQLHEGCDIEQVVIIGEYPPLRQVSPGVHQLAAGGVVRGCSMGRGGSFAEPPGQLTGWQGHTSMGRTPQPQGGIRSEMILTQGCRDS